MITRRDDHEERQSPGTRRVRFSVSGCVPGVLLNAARVLHLFSRGGLTRAVQKNDRVELTWRPRMSGATPGDTREMVADITHKARTTSRHVRFNTRVVLSERVVASRGSSILEKCHEENIVSRRSGTRGCHWRVRQKVGDSSQTVVYDAQACRNHDEGTHHDETGHLADEERRCGKVVQNAASARTSTPATSHVPAGSLKPEVTPQVTPQTKPEVVKPDLKSETAPVPAANIPTPSTPATK